MICHSIFAVIVCFQVAQGLNDTTEFFIENNAIHDNETALSNEELAVAEAALLNNGSEAADGAAFEQVFKQNGHLEGDISRTPSRRDTGQSDDVQTERLRQNAAIDEATARWPNATVPYAVSASYTEKGRNLIAQAIVAIQKASCVRFVPKQQYADYIYFTAESGGCSSDVGRMGRRQEVVLGSRECMVTGVIIHELMHALGFYHEQSRYDRNKFVTIVWANIEADMDSNFLRYESYQIEVLGTPYDYESIMHYGQNAFSKNGEPTVLPNIEEAQIGQRYKLSEFDIYELNKLYDCPGNHSMPEWPYSDSQSNARCGSETIDVLTEGCCDGRRFALSRFICCQETVVLFAAGAGPRVECCGVEAVTPPETCCNGSVIDTRDHVCCPLMDGEAEQPFDIRRYACCGGTLHRRPLSGHWHDYTCCATNLISNESHGCCADHLPFIRETQGCCSGIVFEKQTHFCCNFRIHGIEPGTASHTGCCAGRPYDINAHRCCGGNDLYSSTLNDLYENELCCAGVVYRNQPDKMCCQGLIETKSQVYNKQTHDCCAAGAVNSTVYNFHTHVCCVGRLYTLTANQVSANYENNLGCCDIELYDTEFQSCCSGSSGPVIGPLSAGLHHAVHDPASLCCGAVSLNVRTHQCCYGQVGSLEDAGLNVSEAKQSEDAACCGEVLMNATIHACCGWPHVVVPLAAGLRSGKVHLEPRSKCCGHPVAVSYNAAMHTCCDEQVVTLAPGLIQISQDGLWNPDSMCCGRQSFDGARHDCCDGAVTQLAAGLTSARFTIDERAACCRATSFNLATQTCCSAEGTVIQRGHNCTATST